MPTHAYDETQPAVNRAESNPSADPIYAAPQGNRHDVAYHIIAEFDDAEDGRILQIRRKDGSVLSFCLAELLQ